MIYCIAGKAILSSLVFENGMILFLLSVNSEQNDSNVRRQETILVIAGELLEELLKSNYVAQNDDELWKKKRKSR
jgi:hypothetical protein